MREGCGYCGYVWLFTDILKHQQLLCFSLSISFCSFSFCLCLSVFPFFLSPSSSPYLSVPPSFSPAFSAAWSSHIKMCAMVFSGVTCWTHLYIVAVVATFALSDGLFFGCCVQTADPALPLPVLRQTYGPFAYWVSHSSLAHCKFRLQKSSPPSPKPPNWAHQRILVGSTVNCLLPMGI